MSRPMTEPDRLTNALAMISAPSRRVSIALLGAALRHGGVTISRDEHRALAKLYGFVPEQPRERPPKPAPPPPKADWKAEQDHKRAVEAWEKWEDPRPFHQAGADRNLMRHAEADGLRIVAWLAKFVEPGEDPLRALVRVFVDAGYDIDPADVEWAEAEAEETQEE
jgi:hypothetical protein